MTNPIVPVPFRESIPKSTRRSFVSERFDSPWEIPTIEVAFASNAKRLLQVSFWVTSYGPTIVGTQQLKDDVRPAGTNLMGRYGTQDYVVGDGPEGQIVVQINREFPAGFRFCVEANNTDPVNALTLDVLANVIEHLWKGVG